MIARRLSWSAVSVAALVLVSGCGLFHRSRAATPVVEAPAALPSDDAPVPTPVETPPPVEMPPPPPADPPPVTTARPRDTAVPVRSAPAVLVVKPDELTSATSTRRQKLVGAGRRVDPAEIGYYMDVQQARLQQVGGTWLGVTRSGRSLRLGLNRRWNFKIGSADLSPEAQSALSGVAGVLAEFRLSLITVHGYTDDSGDAAVNQRLSEERALAVARYLVSKGIAADRIVVVGHGAASPLASNASPEGREENRRVELQVDPLT